MICSHFVPAFRELGGLSDLPLSRKNGRGDSDAAQLCTPFTYQSIVARSFSAIFSPFGSFIAPV